MVVIAQIIGFELKKAFANTKNRILILLYMGVLLGFLFYNMSAYDTDRRMRMQQYEEGLEAMRAFLVDLETRLTWPEQMLTEQYVEHTNELLAGVKIHLELRSRMLAAMQSGDRLAFDAEEAAFQQHFTVDNHLIFAEADRLGGNAGTLLKESTVAQHEFMNHCVENNIELLWENEMLGWNYLYSAIKRLLPRVLPLYLLLLLCDLFSTDNASGNFKFTLLQPLPRSRVLVGKTAAAVIFGATAVVLPLLLVALLAGAINGFGSPHYPLLADPDGFLSLVPKPNHIAADMVASLSWHSPPGWEYRLGLSRYSSWDPEISIYFRPNPALTQYGIALFSLLCLPQIFCFTLFCAALALLISLLTQDDAAALVLCALAGLSTFVLSAPVAPLPVIARLNPFLYSLAAEQLAGIGSSTVLTGCLVLLGHSAAITALSCRIFKKRDVRC